MRREGEGGKKGRERRKKGRAREGKVKGKDRDEAGPGGSLRLEKWESRQGEAQ